MTVLCSLKEKSGRGRTDAKSSNRPFKRLQSGSLTPGVDLPKNLNFDLYGDTECHVICFQGNLIVKEE